MEKKCNICNSIKSINDFYKNQTRCKNCTKQYALDNKEKIQSYKHQYRKDNIDFVKDSNKRYYHVNKEVIRSKQSKYYENNKEIVREIQKQYRDSSGEILTLKNRKYSKVRYEKIKSDPLFKLISSMRGALWSGLSKNGFSKKSRTQDIVGCSFEELKIFIESKFESWMTWENYGKYNGELNYGCDIDHIIPLNSAKSEEEILKLNHFTNLQPLCSYTNRHIKSYRMDYVNSGGFLV